MMYPTGVRRLKFNASARLLSPVRVLLRREIGVGCPGEKLLRSDWLQRRRLCWRVRFEKFHPGVVSQDPIMSIGVPKIVVDLFRPGDHLRYRVEVRRRVSDERENEGQQNNFRNPGRG